MPLLTRPRRHSEAGEEENPYWMSFSDIMAGLLILFILACAMLLTQLIALKDKVSDNIAQLHVANQVRRELIEEVANRLRKQGLNVEISENQTVLRIPDQTLFFKTGKYDIQPEHEQALQSIGQAIYEAITTENRKEFLDTIFIEGHTDSRNAPDFLMGNWGLSAIRAIAIWKFWTEKTPYGEAMASLRNRDNKLLFSVSGYAASRRVNEEESSEEALKSNRRIDIRFTTRQPTIKEYSGVIDLFREGTRQ